MTAHIMTLKETEECQSFAPLTLLSLYHSDKWWFAIESYNLKAYGLRAFSVIAPNELPMAIRSIYNINIFKSKLKTFHFKQAYELP